MPDSMPRKEALKFNVINMFETLANENETERIIIGVDQTIEYLI